MFEKKVKALILAVLTISVASAVLSAFVTKKEFNANVVVTRGGALDYRLYNIGSAKEADFSFPSVTPGYSVDYWTTLNCTSGHNILAYISWNVSGLDPRLSLSMYWRAPYNRTSDHPFFDGRCVRVGSDCSQEWLTTESVTVLWSLKCAYFVSDAPLNIGFNLTLWLSTA